LFLSRFASARALALCLLVLLVVVPLR
jgi:hypothetical protein